MPSGACRRFGIDHVAIVVTQLLVHMLRGMGWQVAVLVNGAALDRQLVSPKRDERGLEPGCPVNDDELGPFQPARIEIVEELAPRGGALPAHIPDGKQYLLAVAPHTDGGQNRDVLRLLSRSVLMTVPSRISLTMSSPAKLRMHQPSQSAFTLRHARLTTSLLTAPLNSVNSARFTRRVFVPAR